MYHDRLICREHLEEVRDWHLLKQELEHGIGIAIIGDPIHTLLVEIRARDIDRQVYQDTDSDRHLFPSEKIFDNVTDDLEMIAVSKQSISFLPQKEADRTDHQPFNQETEPLATILCVKMEDDAHQPDELNSHLRVMKSFLKARYRLKELPRAQRNDRMTNK